MPKGTIPVAATSALRTRRRGSGAASVADPRVTRVTDDQFCVTTFSAAVSSDCVGKVTVPFGAAGRAANAALFAVPSFCRLASSIGRAEPSSQRFWPVVE